MNSKKAKALRQLAKDVFLHKKKENDPKMKAQELGERVYMENLNREQWKEYPEMTVIKEPDPNDPSKEIENVKPALDENGKIKMKRYKVAMGTISLHGLCEQGIYKHFKKVFKKDPKNFVKNVTGTIA